MGIRHFNNAYTLGSMAAERIVLMAIPGFVSALKIGFAGQSGGADHFSGLSVQLRNLHGIKAVHAPVTAMRGSALKTGRKAVGANRNHGFSKAFLSSDKRR